MRSVHAKRGQNAAEYVTLLGVVVTAFVLLNASTGGQTAEKLSQGISDQLMLLLTLIRLPF